MFTRTKSTRTLAGTPPPISPQLSTRTACRQSLSPHKVHTDTCRDSPPNSPATVHTDFCRHRCSPAQSPHGHLQGLLFGGRCCRGRFFPEFECRDCSPFALPSFALPSLLRGCGSHGFLGVGPLLLVLEVGVEPVHPGLHPGTGARRRPRRPFVRCLHGPLDRGQRAALAADRGGAAGKPGHVGAAARVPARRGRPRSLPAERAVPEAAGPALSLSLLRRRRAGSAVAPPRHWLKKSRRAAGSEHRRALPSWRWQ